MTRTIIKAGLALLAGLRLGSAAMAQTLVTPGTANRLWVTTPAMPDGLNTAMIDLPCEKSPNKPYASLTACAWGGGGAGSGGVSLRDLRSMKTVTVALPGAGVFSIPDVVLGNNTTSPTPGQDFIMAVAYAAVSGRVKVDFFDIHYPVECDTTFTVAYNRSQTLPMPLPGWSTAGTTLGTVHMDVVAQSTNTSLYGMPLCDQFFTTWDAELPKAPPAIGSLYNVFCSYGTLNTYDAMVSGPVDISLGGAFTIDDWQPDVAGIEVGGGSSTVPYAIIPSVYQNTNVPIYREWNPLGGVITSYTRMDYAYVDPTGTIVGSYTHPRIDADDNYLGSGTCRSVVVLEYSDLVPNKTARLYRPGAPIATGTDISWIDLFPVAGAAPGTPFTGYNHYRPTIAYGSGPGTYAKNQYMVSECVNIPGFLTGSAPDFFVMSPTDGCGTWVAPTPLLMAFNYYLYNMGGGVTSTNYTNAVSTPCNNVNGTSMVTWAQNGSIYHKLNNYNMGTGYAYRSTGTTTPEPEVAKLPAVYPNPATDMITITNPAPLGADRYSITNVQGRTVTGGGLQVGSQQLQVGSLAPGNYTLNVYRDGALKGNTIFVKN